MFMAHSPWTLPPEDYSPSYAKHWQLKIKPGWQNSSGFSCPQRIIWSLMFIRLWWQKWHQTHNRQWVRGVCPGLQQQKKTGTKINFIPKTSTLGSNIARGMCSWWALQSHINLARLSWEVHGDCDIKQWQPHKTVAPFLLNHPKDMPSTPSWLFLSFSEAG